MNEVTGRQNLKGTWNQAILTFLFPVFLVLALRWALVEPFVIPSGSMLPNLLIHDHILVKKFSFGLRVPFLNHWLVRWGHPQRGQILVFKYPQNPDVYYIKRLIGLPGDHIEVRDGRVRVNGQEWSLEPVSSSLYEPGFYYFNEAGTEETHVVRFLAESEDAQGEPEIFEVPPGQYFFMGDNRDQSNDSRFWGFVDEGLIIGPAWRVWLSCESTLPTMTFVCDPAQIRWQRIFLPLQ